jgi:hypothetical protein
VERVAGREVHPVAAVFPLMSDPELDALAEDIKVHGLLHPIILDPEGRVIDGRNRLLACCRAGVDPQFVTRATDVVSLVLGENVLRRQMTRGSVAMAIVLAWEAQEELEPSRRKQRDREAAAVARLHEERFNEARMVVRYASDLVPQVLEGGSLRDAYEVAQQRRRTVHAYDLALKKLRRRHPELGERVDQDVLALEEAEQIAEMLDRRAKVASELSKLTETVTLAEEEVLKRVPPDPEADAARASLVAEAIEDGPMAQTRTARDVMGQVALTFDLATVEREERAVAHLRVRERLLQVVRDYDPQALSADLPIDQARGLAQTLHAVLRWVATAYDTAKTLSEQGRLERV